MGLTPFDVSNLEHSMSSLGDAFVQRRHDEEQRKRDGIEADMRQRMLQAEMRRMDSEENRSKLLSEGTVAATLQDDDGNQVTYRGPQSGYDGFISKTSAQGQNWRPVNTPKKTPYSVKLNLPDGEMELHADDLDQLQTQVQQLRKAKQTAPKNAPSTSGRLQEDKAAADLEAQRDDLISQAQQLATSKASGGPVSDNIDLHMSMLKQQADNLDRRAKFLRGTLQPKPDPTQFETVTETQDDTATGKKISTSRKVPVGQGGDAAVTGNPASSAAGTKKPTRALAAAYVQKYGKDKASDELKKRGYDPSGYAD